MVVFSLIVILVTMEFVKIYSGIAGNNGVIKFTKAVVIIVMEQVGGGNGVASGIYSGIRVTSAVKSPWQQ